METMEIYDVTIPLNSFLNGEVYNNVYNILF